MDSSTLGTRAARPRCDLIMKGGVTSGIVYPEAVYEISRVFDLKSIGGTSAGAIAAALAAAAQYRRLRDGDDGGFEHLRGIPETLASENRLFKLFSPNRATAALFGIAFDLFNPKVPRWRKTLCLARAYPLHAVFGIVPAALYAVAAMSVEPAWARLGHWLVAAIVAAVGAIAAASIGLGWDAWRKLPRNAFGLATGIASDPNDACALGTWLTDELEQTAGLDRRRFPLTFGMLWQPGAAPGPCAIEDPPENQRCAVNLQVVTTSLTQGRPYQFPTRTTRYYFKRDELAQFFPPHVVQWMCDHARLDAPPEQGLIPLPPIGDLPVVVAVRMSLAFPILLSAVPLYAVDDSDAAARTLRKVWFSDGGLTSNFPIQMFDAPLPRWPTLALNVGAFGPGTPADGVVVTGSTAAGRLMRLTPITGVAGFAVSIFNAVQNWNDNLQATLPGFRDRIATIALEPGEGGLNLDMDAATVERLRRRGGDAARALIRRFASPSTLQPDGPVLSWEGHRWTRFRVECATLGNHLRGFQQGYATPFQPGDVAYAALADADDPRTVPLRSYPLGGGDAGRDAARALASATAALAGEYASAVGIDSDVPKPEPSLVVRPNLDR